ncbi:MAG: polyphosphate kinase 2 [Epsilonproteobacteria bacterium]|nr:polyphosphate kinase 2 [Campylobacterota bacterium]
MILNYTKNLPEYQQKAKEVFKKSGKIKTEFYEKELYRLYHELVKLQQWIINNDKRLLIIFEGMDTGGKSSSIKALNYYWNPREARVVALPKPNDKERGQWYFQRYLKQMPNESEIVCFDRSWYNRAGIEEVFGFCTHEEHELFYKQVNDVEQMLVDDGIMIFKFYLSISKETQAKRIKDRENNPLKSWKLTELDYKSHEKYDTYVALRDKMFLNSGTRYAPWTVLDANDKKRARLNLIRFLLLNIDYDNRDSELVCGVDKEIVKMYE